MAKRGRKPGSGTVDDVAGINEVMRLMAGDPALSRRQAIIRVAGQGSLRRLETKMSGSRGMSMPGLDGAKPRLERKTYPGTKLFDGQMNRHGLLRCEYV